MHMAVTRCVRAGVCVCVCVCLGVCACVCVHACMCVQVRVRYLPQARKCVFAALYEWRPRDSRARARACRKSPQETADRAIEEKTI